LGGNPAGVVLDADHLCADQKLSIAQRLGLSETAFVSRSAIAAFRLEFFTPTRQIPHCGHATIASFSYLRDQGLAPVGASSKETIDGIRQIEIGPDDVFMQQPAASYFDLDAEQRALLLASLGIGSGDLHGGLAPCVATTGNAFLLVPLASVAALRALAPDSSAVLALSEQLQLVGYYAFALGASPGEPVAAARMFAPRFGIEEEAATGTAAGPLACLLHDRLACRELVMRFAQGHLMTPPSPSLLTARLSREGDTIRQVHVGGQAYVAATRRIEV